MQCRDVEHVVEKEGLATPLPDAARAHVATCTRCRGLVADFEAIVSAASEMPAEVEPPARVWVSLQNQLELEGIIKPATFPIPQESRPWWQSLDEFFRRRSLATAAVGLAIIAAGIVEMRQPPDGNLPGNSARVLSEPQWQIEFKQTASVLNGQEVDLRNMQLASTSPTAPVDDSYRQSLKQVDEFIADCERRVNSAPQDDLAREYLSNAYQQKAELLSAMMDREGSLH